MASVLINLARHFVYGDETRYLVSKRRGIINGKFIVDSVIGDPSEPFSQVLILRTAKREK
jgi:hypothetical protein